jgi:hypothetical protein
MGDEIFYIPLVFHSHKGRIQVSKTATSFSDDKYHSAQLILVAFWMVHSKLYTRVYILYSASTLPCFIDVDPLKRSGNSTYRSI